MKLAILGTRGIPARYGGFETFTEELSSRLVSRGIEVTVYCEATGEGRPATHGNVKLVYLSSPKLGPFTTILFDLLCLWHARRDYDVDYMLGYGAALFCFLPKLWGTKVWINMDGIEWQRAKWSFFAKSYFKIMEAIAVRTADRIIADAQGIRKFLMNRHSFKTPCSVIPYGSQIIENVQASVLSKYDLKPYDYYLVVCRMEPENHVMEILRGFAASKSRCHLIVIGNHMANTAYGRKLNLVKDERIRFVGALYDQAKLSGLRYYCRAYIHGHSVGGTNPSLLEALGCGNPIIAHDNVFNREVAGEIGAYFRTSDDITQCIEKVDTMKAEERAMLSNAGKNRIRECYNWDMITDRYSELLYERDPMPAVDEIPSNHV